MVVVGVVVVGVVVGVVVVGVVVVGVVVVVVGVVVVGASVVSRVHQSSESSVATSTNEKRTDASPTTVRFSKCIKHRAMLLCNVQTMYTSYHTVRT